jgi:hypothetical protein
LREKKKAPAILYIFTHSYHKKKIITKIYSEYNHKILNKIKIFFNDKEIKKNSTMERENNNDKGEEEDDLIIQEDNEEEEEDILHEDSGYGTFGLLNDSNENNNNNDNYKSPAIFIIDLDFRLIMAGDELIKIRDIKEKMTMYCLKHEMNKDFNACPLTAFTNIDYSG